MISRFTQYIESLLSTGVKLVNTVTVPANGIEEINLFYLDECVILRHSTNDNIVLREYLNRDEKNLYAVVKQAENQINIQHGIRSVVPVCGFLELLIPSDMAKTCNIKTINGSIYSEDVWSLNAFSGDTAGGDILMKSLSADTVELSAGIGAIALGRIAGKMNLQAGCGSIRIEQALGCGKIQTKSGIVETHFIAVNGPVNIESEAGNINLYLPPDYVFEVRAKTDLGIINYGYGENIINIASQNKHDFGRKKVHYMIHITSGRGNICIKDNLE